MFPVSVARLVWRSVPAEADRSPCPVLGKGSRQVTQEPELDEVTDVTGIAVLHNRSL
jgi:hypothetical protein